MEVFSGVGGLSKHLARAGVTPECWDIRHGSHFDLLKPANVRRLMKVIRKSGVIAVHLGTPCTTFSLARHPALRSASHPWGKPDLDPQSQVKVQQGNALARVSAMIMRVCISKGIPFTIENPQSSRIWLLEPFQKILAHPQVQSHTLHFCQYGTPWKKATTIAAFKFPRLSQAMRSCLGHGGLCSRTGKKHFQLSGKDSSGMWLTARGAAYPPQFCSAYSDALIETVLGNFLHTQMNFIR